MRSAGNATSPDGSAKCEWGESLVTTALGYITPSMSLRYREAEKGRTDRTVANGKRA